MMKSLWLGIVLFYGIVGAFQICSANEFAGRLERVDLQTITLRGDNDTLMVVHVDGSHRKQAAPFLGKWVTVDWRDDKGMARVMGLRCPGGK